MARAVVVYRTDGLGQRLMAFGNGLRMARVLRVPCYLSWNETNNVGGISDLGQLLNMQYMAPSVKILPYFRILRELDTSRIYYTGTAGIVDREAVNGADAVLCGLGRMQRFSDEVDLHSMSRDFVAAMRCIVPVPVLVDQARAFSARHDLQAAVGIHVRRGDLVDHKAEAERMRLIGLDRYFAVLDAAAPDGAFFLCTEDQAVIDAFEARYPARVIRYPTRSWSRGDQAAVFDALIEMFLLSATKFIVAGPSAFSRFAATRNAIPLAMLQNSHSVERSVDLAKAAAHVARQRQSRLSPLAR